MRKYYKILPLNQNKDPPEIKLWHINSPVKHSTSMVAVLRDTDNLPWIFLHLPQNFHVEGKGKIRA